MARFLCMLFIVLVWVALSAAQDTVPRIQSVKELASALSARHRDREANEQLLKTHPQLVNIRLWYELNDQAASAYYTQSPERALEIYEVLLRLAHQLGDQRLLGKTYYNIGRTYSGLTRFQLAVEAYEKSRTYFDQAGRQRDLIYILADLGALYLALEDYQRARDYSEKSLNLANKGEIKVTPPGAWPDDYGKAGALATLAEMDLRDGAYDGAVEKLQTSLALYEKLNRATASYRGYIANDFAGLGRTYTAAGDHVQALFYLTKALEIIKTVSDTDTMASLLNSIGYVYMEQEDYAQAKQKFDESLKIYLAEDNPREVARVQLNLGVVAQREANYDEALTLFKLSFQKAKTAQTVDGQIAANEGIGVVLAAKKEFAAALQVLDQSIGLNKETKDKTRQTELLWRSAEVRYEMRDYARASELAQAAIDLARVAHLPKLTYLSTTTLGQAYAAQNKLELATQTLIEAVEQAEAMRYQVAGREVERQLFFENKVSSYNSLIDLLIKQGRVVDAFLYAERAKGRVLLDVLGKDTPGLAKILTPTEKEKGQQLNRRISEINDRIKLQEPANSSSLISLYSQLDAARLEYQSFQDALSVTHPGLSIRSGRTPILTATSVNELTQDNGSAYLEYVAGKDQVSLFVLTKDKSPGTFNLKVYPLAIKPDDLVRKVNQFHDALSEKRPTYEAVARELYALLVKPAEQQLQGIETMCIVPDGFLWNVAFQALMTTNEHYLLEDHAVYYAPSLSVLREMNRKTARRANDASLIAFGNPVIGRDEQRNTELCPLVEAEAEVTSIAKRFEAVDKKVFIGREATEKTFKALASSYSVIHLATHGVIDNREPLFSHLLLAKTNGDQENDGLLEAREIMDMNLRADLAVLSACETANGKISPGEGVMGMSWAFFVAGTQAMLVSQWRIDSSSTSQLMANFYQSLTSDRESGNVRKARALREAALKLQKDDRYHHPFFWAGFVLVGVN